MEYDPLLAKLAVWAPTRAEAIERMIRALREYDVGGIRTNIGFFRQILQDSEFRAARLHTGFIEEFFERHQAPRPPSDLADVAAVAAALYTISRKEPAQEAPPAQTSRAWLEAGRDGLLR
jgi:acetyl-CoA carboxylase biotin carboxylase subunit